MTEGWALNSFSLARLYSVHRPEVKNNGQGRFTASISILCNYKISDLTPRLVNYNVIVLRGQLLNLVATYSAGWTYGLGAKT